MAGPRDQNRVVLHVGLPKSGTTFLQQSLRDNAEALADRGVLYPQTDDDVMFRAALDVRGNHKAWGRRRKDVEGAWDRLCDRARRHLGTTVVSQELLGAACGRQVDAALSMLKGLDVHLLVTARDPARQLVSEWQEGVKHGRRLTFEEFHHAVIRGDTDAAARYHATQALTGVLDRWGRWLPADHVHVVVAPPRGTDPRVLWTRFATAVGFDASGFPATTSRANETLGVDEVALLRRVNVALDGRLRQPAYGRLVKHRVAQDLLVGRGSPRPELPRAGYDGLVDLAEGWVKEVDRAGYRVHGRLDDLVPVRPEADHPHPDAASTDGQLGAAVDVLAGLLLDLTEAEEELAEQRSKRRSWKKQAKRLRRRLAET